MLLACVPNISLGPQDAGLEPVIDAVREATGPGCRLLDVHTDRDHRRTVLTLAGAPVPLLSVTITLGQALAENATLEGHEGVHPRIGLMDVVPFVTLAAPSGEAIRLGEAAMRRLGEAGVPTYAYARLARDASRRELAGIRRRLQGTELGNQPDLHPDAGPTSLHPSMGAVCVGVRDPLVAYNVLLETQDVEIGRQIASAIRARSGGLPGLQALAFPLASRGGRIQVSTNVTDTHRLGLEDVYERVAQEAGQHGTDVLAGELVGLAPRRCLPKDASRMGLEQGPVSLEEALRDAGLTLDEVP